MNYPKINSLNISILGAGWLGKPLAKALQTQHKVKTSLRDREILQGTDFYSCDVLIISLPPRENYLQNIKNILEQTSQKTQIILLSSTSVYSQKRQGKMQLLGEDALINAYKNYLILRLGGLMGYDRIAGKYTQGKEVASDSYTNYIHRDDVIQIINALVGCKVQEKIFNLVCPEHTSKKEVYDKNAKLFNLGKTRFLSLEMKGKKISSKKVRDFLKYEFIYKSPLDFHQ